MIPEGQPNRAIREADHVPIVIPRHEEVVARLSLSSACSHATAGSLPSIVSKLDLAAPLAAVKRRTGGICRAIREARDARRSEVAAAEEGAGERTKRAGSALFALATFVIFAWAARSCSGGAGPRRDSHRPLHRDRRSPSVESPNAAGSVGATGEEEEEEAGQRRLRRREERRDRVVARKLDRLRDRMGREAQRRERERIGNVRASQAEMMMPGEEAAGEEEFWAGGLVMGDMDREEVFVLLRRAV